MRDEEQRAREVAEVFPGAAAEVVVDDGRDLLVALRYAPPRRGGREPTLRQRADLVRPAALRLFETVATIPQRVTVLVARDAEEVSALSAAWLIGEEARSRAIREHGRWDHLGGRGAGAFLLDAARAQGRLVEHEARGPNYMTKTAPEPPRGKPVGPRKRGRRG